MRGSSRAFWNLEQRYLYRQTIRPIVGSYAETSTSTESPGMIRIIRPLRIFPDARAVTSWPVSSFTRNVAFGNVSTTTPFALK